MTNEAIDELLNSYRPDQAAVIHEMAATRGLNPRNLFPNEYRDLLREEAEFSLRATPDHEVGFRELAYSADLLALASLIH